MEEGNVHLLLIPQKLDKIIELLMDFLHFYIFNMYIIDT